MADEVPRSQKNLHQRKKEIQATARAAMNLVREKITMRITGNDLMRLKVKAICESIPHQTLIGSIWHNAVC